MATKGPGPLPGRRRGLGFAAAVLAAFLGGCARPGAGGDELVLWAMGSEAEAAARLVDGFRERHPGVRVRVQALPWSAAHEKLLTAFVAGSMPDVFQLGNTWVPELATLGALEPLDAQVAASVEARRDVFFEGALDGNVSGGHLVALPWYVDARVLFYRKDLLAAAGIAEAPRSWEAWIHAMRRVRQRGQEDGLERYGVFLPMDEWQTPVSLALQQGARLLKDGDGRGNFSSEPVRTAFGFYASLFADGVAPVAAAAQLSSVHREFAAGYFGFLVSGPWNLVELEKVMPPALGRDWTTAPLPSPRGDEPGVSVAGGASLAVSSSSRRKDDAFKLVEYLTSAESQLLLRRLTGDLPSRRDAWQDESLAGYDRALAFRTQMDHLAAAPALPEWERIASKVSSHLERVVRGLATVDEATAAIDADVDAILAKRRSLAAGAPR